MMAEPVSPSEPLPQSDDPEFHSLTEEFEHRVSDGAEWVKAEITLMRETWDEVRRSSRLMGGSSTRADYHPDGRTRTHICPGCCRISARELQNLLDCLMAIEARYASIKNFVFDVMRDHRALTKRFCMSLVASGSVSWMRWEVGRSVRDNSVKVRRKGQVTRDGSPAS